jgi:hypothetical protein
MSHFAHGAGRLPPAYATRLAADDPRLKITAMLSYGPPATVRVESNWLKFSFLPPADTSADKRGYPLTEHIWPRLVTHNANTAPCITVADVFGPAGGIVRAS